MKTAVVFKWVRDPQDARVAADGALSWPNVKFSPTDDDPAAMDVARALSAEEDIVGITIGDGKPEWAAARGAASTVIVEDCFGGSDGSAAAAPIAAAIVASGADAAMGLAEKISGSESDFVNLMNEKAEELGLEDTHFSNSSGLFDSEQYTSAYDMAIILETAIQDPLRRKILSTYQYTTAPTPQHPEGIALSSTLFDYMYGTEPETATIQGGKTGFINEAGYCIASYGANNTTGNEYIVVTLKNSSRNPAIFGQIDLYKQFAE